MKIIPIPQPKCSCREIVRCSDCNTDIEIAAIQRHSNAGHSIQPYGCEYCRAALRENP